MCRYEYNYLKNIEANPADVNKYLTRALGNLF